MGTAATDWANDGLFGDGWHLLGIGSSAYSDASDEYTEAMNAVNAFMETGGEGADELAEALDTEAENFDAAGATALLEQYAAQFSPTDKASIEIVNEEDLSSEEVTYTGQDLQAAIGTLDGCEYAEPDPADYGVWVPGIPVLVENGLDRCKRARLAQRPDSRRHCGGRRRGAWFCAADARALPAARLP